MMDASNPSNQRRAAVEASQRLARERERVIAHEIHQRVAGALAQTAAVCKAQYDRRTP